MFPMDKKWSDFSTLVHVPIERHGLFSHSVVLSQAHTGFSYTLDDYWRGHIDCKGAETLYYVHVYSFITRDTVSYGSVVLFSHIQWPLL